MKNNKIIFALILSLLVVSGLVFANRGNNNDPSVKPTPKKDLIADSKADREAPKAWANTPDGIRFKMWEISPEGKKVHASHDKIRKYIKDFSNMNAVVTSVTFKRANAEPSGPKWMIVKIDGEEYMMQFVGEEFQKFKGIKVNDKIIVKSHSAGYSPNHPYLIVSGDYIEHNGRVLFVREFNKNGGC